MATTWSGFSPEDQARIISETEIVNGTNVVTNGEVNNLQSATNTGEVRSAFRKSNQKPKKISPASPTGTKTNDLPAEALLSLKNRQQKGPESPAHVKLRILEDTSFEIMENIPLENGADRTDNNSCDQEDKDTEANPAVPLSARPLLTLSVDLLQNGGKKDPITLEEFEKKQKIIEEQNRLKKEMLGKALAMRKMKTQAEAHKIQQIQDELAKLDASLSNDVHILRSHIEIASVELSDAEKRYVKAEREFIEAKQLLFNKRERKDLLTEHLCTIIEQNELRKAHRLTDLMIKLDEEEIRREVIVNPSNTPDSV